MKKKFIKFIANQWLLLWIIIAAMGLTVIIVSAESLFTLSPMERVIVTKDGHGILFSSNILTDLIEDVVTVEGTPTTVTRPSYQPIYRTELVSGTYDVDVFLWNYNILDDTTYYSEDINYRIDAVLTDREGTPLTASNLGSRTITITPVSPSGSAVTLSASNLSGTFSSECLEYSNSSSTENEYQISFSEGWDLDDDTDICIMLTVTPTTRDNHTAYSDLKNLGRIIGLRRSVTTGSNGWKSTLSEKSNNNYPSDFDAYNLVLSGSGSSTITIEWDTSKLGLNKNFYTYYDPDTTDADPALTANLFGFYTNGTDYKEVDYTAPTGSSTWARIVIHADTSNDDQDNRNRYSVQLYKLGVLDDPNDWSFYAFGQSAAEAPNAWIRVNIT